MGLQEGDIIYLPKQGLCKINKIVVDKIEIFENKKIGFLKYEKISTGNFYTRIKEIWVDPIGNNTGLVTGYNYLMYDEKGWESCKLEAIRILNQIKHL